MDQLFNVTMPKKEMAQRVQKFCQKCMGRQAKRFCETRDCDLYPIRILRTKVPDQQHLFRTGLYVDFCGEILRVAMSFEGPFYFSELRLRAGVTPLHHNWWGAVTRSKTWKQTFRQTGEHRRSPIKSVNGTAEFQWTRKYPRMAAAHG